MSRIIVKQLPKNISEEKLRNLFGAKGRITDLQLKFTPDGKFRQFCFIGYENEEEAQAAIKFFNNTCIQTSRIKVEICGALGSDEKPKAWSKHCKEILIPTDEKEEKKTKIIKHKNAKVDEILGKHKTDPKFQEFLKAHDKNRALWENDADAAEDIDEEEKQTVNDKNDSVEPKIDSDTDNEDKNINDSYEDETTEKKLAEKPISDLDYMKSLIVSKTKNESKTEQPKKKQEKARASVDLFTVKIRNIPYTVKRPDILKFFKPLKPYSVRLPAKSSGFCYVGFKTEKELSKALLKHKSFLKGTQVFITDFTEKNKITKETKENDLHKKKSSANPKWAKQAESLQNEENISESGTIFFRNLAYTVTDDDLQKLFESFGPIAEIDLPVDALTRQIKGFGTVTFVMPDHALLAFNKLDGTDFHGRLLHLLPGKNRDQEKELKEDDSSLSFKQKKAIKLKKSAQQSTNWNSLFLGSNAIAEILAKSFETSKERILDTNGGGSSAAVRIALGETQLVMEMKKFLEEQNVCLEAFNTPTTKRSKVIILAKNLPAETKVDELLPLFRKFGPISRLVLPPSGVTALIEYCDATEARKAFKNLAYSKFKHLPLYLEWAPENVFTKAADGTQTSAKIEESSMKKEELVIANQTETNKNTEKETNYTANNSEDDDDNAMEPEPNTTLFLRNLNFKTQPETVRNHFIHLGATHTVEIAKRRDPENPRNTSSLGYGFIQFKKSAVSDKALKIMQFTNIDGNQVELKRSDRVLKSQTERKRHSVKVTEQTGTKILIRNIPFQAKEKEIRDIFKAFGELRSVRLPKKTTPGEEGHIRGFGFVDFITKSDAKKAFEALGQSTHLYGRRLVLEWAAIDEDSVQEIQKRTAEQIQQNSAGSQNTGKRKKIEVNTNVEMI